MLPLECVVRGYLAGSGWKDYGRTGAVCGIPLPDGPARGRPAAAARSSRRRPRRPAGTTRTSRAEQGIELVGDERYREVERVSIALYERAAAAALERGIILADTKFEFGIDADGALVVGDEVLTPDSSRFWPADSYAPGSSPPSFDKQFVRDWLETPDWDKTPPGPELPDEVRDGTAARYREAYERLAGRPFASYLEEMGVSAREGDRARAAQGRASSTRRARPSARRSRRSATPRARCARAGVRRRARRRATRPRPSAIGREAADRVLANGLIEGYEVVVEGVARSAEAPRGRRGRRGVRR